jgi:hypothetical protein
LASGGGTFSVDYGPGASTNIVIIVNEGNNPNASTAWIYTASVFGGYNYATFTENTNLTQSLIVRNGAVYDRGFCTSTVVTQEQVVYFNDFQVAVGAGWSTSLTSFTPTNNQRFLGTFFNDTINFTLTNLPPHEELNVAFDLFIINSWEGNDPTLGPDIWDMTMAGSNVVHTTFSNFGFQRQSYPGQYPAGNFAGQTGATETNVLGYFQDSVYEISQTLPHSTNNIQVSLSAMGLQPAPDEFWGIDNFQVATLARFTNDPSCGYYLPEEPLTPLFGENAFGDWKLEIWDSRLGGGPRMAHCCRGK